MMMFKGVNVLKKMVGVSTSSNTEQQSSCSEVFGSCWSMIPLHWEFCQLEKGSHHYSESIQRVDAAVPRSKISSEHLVLQCFRGRR